MSVHMHNDPGPPPPPEQVGADAFAEPRQPNLRDRQVVPLDDSKRAWLDRVDPERLSPMDRGRLLALQSQTTGYDKLIVDQVVARIPAGGDRLGVAERDLQSLRNLHASDAAGRPSPARQRVLETREAMRRSMAQSIRRADTSLTPSQADEKAKAWATEKFTAEDERDRQRMAALATEVDALRKAAS